MSDVEEITPAVAEYTNWKFQYPTPDFDLSPSDAFMAGWNHAIAMALGEIRGLPAWGSLSGSGGFDLPGENERGAVYAVVRDLAQDTSERNREIAKQARSDSQP